MKKPVRALAGALTALLLLLSPLPTGAAQSPELPEITIPNGDFTDGIANWSLSGLNGTVSGNESSASHYQVLDLWVSDSAPSEISVAYTLKLTAGDYRFRFDLEGKEADSGLSWTVRKGETALRSGAGTLTTVGWDQWQNIETDVFTLTEPAEVSFVLSGTQPAGYWGHLDNLKLFGVGDIYSAITLDHQPTLAVERVNGVEDNAFIRGADVSSFLSIYNSGVLSH